MASTDKEIIYEDGVETLRPIIRRAKKERPFDVAAILRRKRCNPIEILADIALGDSRALGVDEPIRVIERRLAASELASYTVAKIKPKELADDEMELESIPVFVPKRGVNFEDTHESKSLEDNSTPQENYIEEDNGDEYIEDDGEYIEDAIYVEEREYSESDIINNLSEDEFDEED